MQQNGSKMAIRNMLSYMKDIETKQPKVKDINKGLLTRRIPKKNNNINNLSNMADYIAQIRKAFKDG